MFGFALCSFGVLVLCDTVRALRTRNASQDDILGPVDGLVTPQDFPSDDDLFDSSLIVEVDDTSSTAPESDWDRPEVVDLRNCHVRVGGTDYDWTDICKTGKCKPTPGSWQEEWVQLPPQKQPRGPPKLAILMLIYDRLNVPELWVQWLREADAAGLSYKMMIHRKDSGKPLKGSTGLEPYVLPNSSWTHWCKNTGAEWQLLHEALLDPAVTHLATFSGDSIPVRPMAKVYEELAGDGATRMCMDWAFRPPRAEMWWLMRRADAALFLEHRENIEHTFKLGCDDEDLWMHALALRSWQWGQDVAPLKNQCVMFTDWTGSCKAWANHGDESHFQHLRSETCNKASSGHPKTFFNITEESMQELRTSSFWWARKFEGKR